ncbi:MAG: alpha/beta fold hydrolase [Panacagrimonas sp.]
MTKNALTSRTLDVGTRKVFVSEQGTGFPVIMLHGGGPGAAGLSNYSRNIEALAQNFRVIVPDMIGYGGSTKGVDRSDPFGDNAEAMLGLMNALRIKSAHFVGNSLGGAVALRIALDQPQVVASMVLMGPGGIGTSRGLPTKGLNQLLDYYNGKGPSLDKIRTFIREFLVYDGSQVPDEVIRKRYESSIDPEVMAAPPLRRPKGLPALLRMDFTRDARLAKCLTPTLVVWGTEDKVNRPSGGRTLQKAMRNCDLVLFSKTGHWAQWERADEFNAATTAFLLRHTPSA